MASEDKPAGIDAYLRRGRRKQIYAPPVQLEEGWKPKVIPKDDAARDKINKVMQSNILFQNLDQEEKSILVDAMELKSFDSDAVIIQQGDLGDFFYVLESGHCDIFVEGIGKVMDVAPGGSFGELALMYNAPRAATVIATEPSQAWAVDQVTFKKTIMDATMKKRKRHIEFLRQVPVLEELLDYERMTIADALIMQTYAAGEDILKEGDAGDEFFIVQDGEVKCTKIGVSHEVSPRLSTGAYFGELALLRDAPRAATVTAVTDVSCLVLDRDTFKRLLGPIETIFQRNYKVYERYLHLDNKPKNDEEDDTSDNKTKANTEHTTSVEY